MLALSNGRVRSSPSRISDVEIAIRTESEATRIIQTRGEDGELSGGRSQSLCLGSDCEKWGKQCQEHRTSPQSYQPY
ncbi:MAG: hypothetical protein PVSMB2_34710 [Ktedonobacteraceae bacterium]